MHWFHLNGSIRNRLLGTLLLILLGISAFTVLFFPARQERALLSALEDKLLTIWDLVAFVAEGELEWGENSSMRNVLEGLKRSEGGISVTVLDRDGRPLVEYPPESILSSGHLVPLGEKKIMNFGEMLVLGMPLSNGAGTLYIGHDLKAMKRYMARFRWMTLFIYLAMCSIGGVIMYRVATTIIRPVTRLERAAQRMAQGDLAEDVRPCSRDEIGRLTEVFQHLQQRLRKMAHQALEIAQGDLSQELEEDGDLLAEAFNQMAGALRRRTQQIQEAASQITLASSEILSASEQQVNGATQQALSVEELTATVEELSETAHEIAESGETVSALAQASLDRVEEGQKAMIESVAGIEDIRTKTEVSARRISELGAKSSQIGEILELINGVAAETRILSLNARIEAAKAGEYGRGFSVVAMEIRKLAERVIKSTGTIKEIVEEIQRLVRASVLASEENVQGVERQVDLSNRAQEVFREIVEMAEQTAEVARQIALSTNQQRTASEQMVVAVGEIAEVSRQSAAGSQQAQVAADTLNDLADRLQRTLHPFTLEQDYGECV